jgi:DDE superfamily endonuclease
LLFTKDPVIVPVLFIENWLANKGILMAYTSRFRKKDGLMVEWIYSIWKVYGGKEDEKILILLDDFSVHLNGKVKQAFTDCNTAVEYIPPVYTSKLQVCDVGINKPFEDRLRREYNIWLTNHKAESRPKQEDIVYWIDCSWNESTSQTITYSWRRCLAFQQSIINLLHDPIISTFEELQMERENNFLEIDQDPFIVLVQFLKVCVQLQNQHQDKYKTNTHSVYTMLHSQYVKRLLQ